MRINVRSHLAAIGAVVGVESCFYANCGTRCPLCARSASNCNCCCPKSHSPSPLSPLMWPSAPPLTKLLPQRRAHRAALSRLIHGSLLLAISVDGQSNGSCGNWAATPNLPGSAGATSSTPATWPTSAAMLWTLARQPKLWAIISVGRRSCWREAVTRADQAARSGVSQSSCPTRSKCEYRRCQRLCQCAAPLLCRPGATRTRNSLSKLAAMALSRLFRLVNLVKHAAVGEVGFLRLGPVARHVGQREQLHRRELRRVFLGFLVDSRAVVVLGDQLLRCVSVEEIQIRLRQLARAALVDHLVDHGHRRLGQNADRRRDDLYLVRAQLLDRQISLVFPRDQHIADAALDEGGGGAARAGIEHRHVFIQFFQEFAGRRVAASRLAQRVAVGRQVVLAGAARSFRVRRDYGHARLDQIVPVLDALGIA